MLPAPAQSTCGGSWTPPLTEGPGAFDPRHGVNRFLTVIEYG